MQYLLDTDAVAQMLGVKAETVRWYSKHRTARQPHFPKPDERFGRTPVWKQSTIEEWVAARPSTKAAQS